MSDLMQELEDLRRRVGESDNDIQRTLMMGFAAAAASDTLRAQRAEAVELLRKARALLLLSFTKDLLNLHPGWFEVMQDIDRFIERIDALKGEAE